MKISLNKKKLTDIAFIVPSLAGVSIFVLIPFIDVLRRSFTNVSGTQFVFFSNYITIFQNAAFRLAFSNTIKFMVICIPILMIFSLRLLNTVRILLPSLRSSLQKERESSLLPL